MDEDRNVKMRVLMEEIAAFTGLVMVQFLCAGNSVMLNYLQNFVGLSSSSIIIFSSLAIFLLLFPPGFFLERDKWPKKLSLKLMVSMILISFAVVMYQLLLLKGIKLTSPAMSTAMGNLTPGFIFIMATAIGLEKVDLENIYSKVKIAGTLICISGALTISIFKSKTEINVGEDTMLNSDKIIGFLCLLATFVFLSASIILQAIVVSEFPAPLSLCSISSIIGTFITTIIELVQNHKIETGLLMANSIELVGYYLLLGAINGLLNCISLWVMKKKGPVLVTMFSPLSTVISVFFSYFILGETFSIGSLVGMLIMFVGLYYFLWAKGKEDGTREGNTKDSGVEYDTERPLLS